MPETGPSLYETLLQNFTGELELHRVAEHEQHLLSVLDNLQRLLNCRAGALAHLPDYGLPDMSTLLQGLPASAHGLSATLAERLLKYEPRLAAIEVELLAQSRPGHLDYRMDVRLKAGGQASFGTTLGAEGRVVVRHLKRQRLLSS